jgi:hypothetical protein
MRRIVSALFAVVTIVIVMFMFHPVVRDCACCL